ncbi:hypothetical protein NDU88_005833 [Pleurodeles waltl]|uniref:Uncharacterized protein n=1 Tax=Pleurodeles waltl TaxID=8319 RepID=A0AAV7PGJ5_PLEWA|nr:hypothetical protein NDU88_005833 [Pleurodeles waltl]
MDHQVQYLSECVEKRAVHRVWERDVAGFDAASVSVLRGEGAEASRRGIGSLLQSGGGEVALVARSRSLGTSGKVEVWRSQDAAGQSHGVAVMSQVLRLSWVA